jgi:phosphoserine aminotransferase
MFGPNTDITTNIVTDFSHRDTHFINLYKELSNLMLDKAGLHRHKYDVLFMGGSGTLAIESVFWSVLHPIDVIGNEGLWHDKWLEFDRRQPKSKTNGTHKLYCQLETSNGKTFDDADCIVDGISSFPYYDIPKNTKIFVTTSNKQLGSLAGLSIIFIRKDFWNEMQSDAIFSYMNLARYKNYGFIGQTPSTAPVTIFQHLQEQMVKFDVEKLRNKIDRNSELLIDIFGGEPSPVFVVPKTDIPIEIAIKYNLYGMNTDSKNYSIFTYTSDTYKYERFHKEFK